MRRTSNRRGHWSLTTALVGCLGLAPVTAAHADVVTDWNQNIVTIGGPQIQRTLAMVHIAMFDAINAIDPRYTPYLTLPAPPAGASAEAAAASAAHGVLVRLFPGQQGAIDAFLVASLAAIPDGPGEDAGVAYGDLVARAIYEARLSDNILATGPTYVAGTAPGTYQLTTPGPPQPVNTNAPHWVPFALQSASQFRPNGPAALTSTKYARDLAEVQRRGALVGCDRPEDESVIARWHRAGTVPVQSHRARRGSWRWAHTSRARPALRAPQHRAG